MGSMSATEKSARRRITPGQTPSNSFLIDPTDLQKVGGSDIGGVARAALTGVGMVEILAGCNPVSAQSGTEASFLLVSNKTPEVDGMALSNVSTQIHVQTPNRKIDYSVTVATTPDGELLPLRFATYTNGAGQIQTEALWPVYSDVQVDKETFRALVFFNVKKDVWQQALDNKNENNIIPLEISPQNLQKPFYSVIFKNGPNMPENFQAEYNVLKQQGLAGNPDKIEALVDKYFEGISVADPNAPDENIAKTTALRFSFKEQPADKKKALIQQVSQLLSGLTDKAEASELQAVATPTVRVPIRTATPAPVVPTAAPRATEAAPATATTPAKSVISPDKTGGIVGIPDLNKDTALRQAVDSAMATYNTVMNPEKPITSLDITISKDGRVFATVPGTKSAVPLFVAEKNRSGEWVWRATGYKDVTPPGKITGAAINVWSNDFARDPRYKETYIKLFGVGSTDGALDNWKIFDKIKVPEGGKLSPQEAVNQYDWGDFDTIVKFLKTNNIPLRLQHLLNFGNKNEVPSWMKQFTDDELRTFIDLHIKAIANRVTTDGSEVDEASVVNEAFWNNGFGPNMFLNTRFKDGEYIRIAFNSAKAVMPNAKLILNDNVSYEKDTNKVMNNETNVIFNFVKGEKEKPNGIKIDAVGLESHLLARDFIQGGIDTADKNIEQFKQEMLQFMSKFKTINTEVLITELDVNMGGLPANMTQDQKEALKAKIYKAVFEAAIESDNCSSVTTWGFTNVSSWENNKSYPYQPAESPLPLDKQYQPTQSYYAIMEALFNKIIR